MLACWCITTAHIQHSTLSTQPSTLDTRHSTLNTRHSTLDTGRLQSSTTSLNLCRGSQTMTLPNWTELPIPFLLVTFGNLALSAHVHAQPRGRLIYNKGKRKPASRSHKIDYSKCTHLSGAFILTVSSPSFQIAQLPSSRQYCGM